MITLVFNGYPHLRRYCSGAVPDGVTAKGDKVGEKKVSDGIVEVSEADAAAILADHPTAFIEIAEAPKAAEGAKKAK